MLAKQRQSMILEHVRRSGGVRVSELTDLLGVSDMTVRRDLDVLARDGLIEKVHGGATPASTSSLDEPGFEAKSSRELGEKDAIGRAAAQLVRPGTAIALSAGTTTWALARYISSVDDLTIATNSVRVADVLLQGPGRPTVILTGGVRTPSDALVGPVADLAIRSLHFDMFFLGCHGMDPEAGLTAPNLAESETNRSFIRVARRIVLVADHTKWRTVGLSSFAELSEVDVLVTDTGLAEADRAIVREYVDRLIVAGETDAASAAPADGAPRRPATTAEPRPAASKAG
jgi:DeoR/GlpR family transcriptional regulator of sugar metabolism